MTQPNAFPLELNWKCTRCGSCCWIIGCSNLTSDRLCSIYSTRPETCRVKEDPSESCQKCRELEQQLRRQLKSPPKSSIENLIKLSKGLIKNS